MSTDAWRCVMGHGFAPWSGRSDLHHIEFASGVVDAMTHMGCHMVHGGTIVILGIQWCTELFLRVQCFAKECRGVYLCTTKHDDSQQVVGVLLMDKSPKRDVRCTIRFVTPIFGEQVDHRADRDLSFIILQLCTLAQGTWLLSLDALITSNKK